MSRHTVKYVRYLTEENGYLECTCGWQRLLPYPPVADLSNVRTLSRHEHLEPTGAAGAAAAGA